MSGTYHKMLHGANFYDEVASKNCAVEPVQSPVEKKSEPAWATHRLHEQHLRPKS